MRKEVMLLAALATPAFAHAQNPGTTADSVTPVKVGVKPAHTALLIGGAILAAGLIDDKVQAEAQGWRNPTTNSLARFGNNFGNGVLLFPALVTTWVAGTAFGSDGVRTAAGHALVAAATGGLAAVAIKYTVGRMRPNSGFDSDHYDWFELKDSSFPSGHTAVAFSVASSLSRDIRGHWDEVALYGLASLTGLARINDNKHWLSDVVGGAAVGIFAGKWATRGNRHVSVSPSGVRVSLDF
jgi:membrane-associated phospholipid phosphatase